MGEVTLLNASTKFSHEQATPKSDLSTSIIEGDNHGYAH